MQRSITSIGRSPILQWSILYSSSNFSFSYNHHGTFSDPSWGPKNWTDPSCSTSQASTRKCWFVQRVFNGHACTNIPSLPISRKMKFAPSHTAMRSIRTSIFLKTKQSSMLDAEQLSWACKRSHRQLATESADYLWYRFAVRAGAKHVIGVDMSTIIEKAQEIVDVNGMSNKITLLQGKMEEVKMPFPQVDIILSEWMGYFLLYESMLDTVLYARDHYLAPDGLIFPDKATIFLAGIEDGEYKDEKIGCKLRPNASLDESKLTRPTSVWDNVYGFDFSPLKDTALTEPLVDTVEMKACVTEPATLITIDLYTVKPPDLAFSAPFVLDCRRNDFIHALIAWFDVDFTACHKPIRFSTGPHTKYTHWKQTVFYLREVLTVEENEQVRGVLSSKQNARKKRDLDIDITYRLDTDSSIRVAQGRCQYKMWENKRLRTRDWSWHQPGVDHRST